MRSVVVGVATLVAVVVMSLGGVRPAAAEDANAKALKPYAGKLVISPDAAPTIGNELPAYLRGNLSKDGSYELIKGPPWPFHVTAVLVTATKTVTLVITDKADAKSVPLLSVPFTLAGNRKLLLAQAEATIAAGFAASKTYVVRLMAGKKQLAKSELTLRD